MLQNTRNTGCHCVDEPTRSRSRPSGVVYARWILLIGVTLLLLAG